MRTDREYDNAGAGRGSTRTTVDDVVEESPESKAVRDAGAGLAASTAGGLIGLAAGTGSPTGAALAAVPSGLLAVRALASRAVQLSERSAQRVIKRAADICDVGLDIFHERAEAYDERIALVGRVLTAASATVLEEKIEALAKVLADGFRPVDGAAEEAMVLAAALTDVEAPHVDLLDYLAQHRMPPPELRRQTEVERPGWEISEIKRASPAFAIADALVAVLGGHGLIADQGGITYAGAMGPAVYGVTELGERFLILFDRRHPTG